MFKANLSWQNEAITYPAHDSTYYVQNFSKMKIKSITNSSSQISMARRVYLYKDGEEVNCIAIDNIHTDDIIDISDIDEVRLFVQGKRSSDISSSVGSSYNVTMLFTLCN